jgi:hypothetical protein
MKRQPRSVLAFVRPSPPPPQQPPLAAKVTRLVMVSPAQALVIEHIIDQFLADHEAAQKGGER